MKSLFCAQCLVKKKDRQKMEVPLKNTLTIAVVIYSCALITMGENLCAPCTCECPTHGWVSQPCVNCEGLNLKSVPVLPIFLTKITKTLKLGYNDIRTLDSGVFSNYSNLVELQLNNNWISSLDGSWFRGLGKLEYLNLDKNDIQVIRNHTFRHTKSLKSLSITTNRIKDIFEDSWNGLGLLINLRLRKNYIKTLKRNTFRRLHSLINLDLEYNRIYSISKDSFTDLGKLGFLELENNNLQSLQHDTFVELQSLKGLLLSKNKISSIERETFIPLRKLITLDLENNNLKQIPAALWTSHSSKVELTIRNNPFRCSCGFLNKVKQLQPQVKKLIPDLTYFEQQCIITTSVCEEERNFAYGMNFTYNCSTAGLHSGYTFAGNKSKIPEWCPSSTCWQYLRISLPGIIVVSNAILNMTFFQRYERNYSIVINLNVEDKQNFTYTQCGSLILTPSASTVNILSTTRCSGRSVLIDIIPNSNYIVSQSHCAMVMNNLVTFGRNEVLVYGYEENKYNIWSSWDQWGQCNKPCGYGTRLRNRTCTNPTSVKCLKSRIKNQRSSVDHEKESCIIIPCSMAVYYWSIGGVAGFFVLIIFGITFWYRKFKMVTYFDGLRPNPNFQLDPNQTLLEQIEDLHWEFPRYDVRFGSVIGEGNFGRVWHAKAKGIKAFNPRDKSDLSSRAKLAKLQDQRVHEYFTTVTEAWVLGDCDTTHYYDVAVKTLKESATPKHKMDLASELKLLIYMDRHPNIVNVLAACTIRGDLWIIMEFCNNGCLKQFLSDRRKTFNPSWSKESVDITSTLCLFDLLQMSEQIIKGVMFLHCWKMVHRDLSARNILVDSNFHLKIADFGLARSDNFVASVDDIMPIKWTALESLLRHEYTTKSDIWSVGVLLWEVFSLGEMPYPGMTSREVIQQLKMGYRMEPPMHCPDGIWKIISDCWHVDPEQRPNSSEIFGQFDEIKMSVCSGPDGQYYGTGVDDQQAGTVQGPSFHKIMEAKDEIELRSEMSSSGDDKHNTKRNRCIQESGPSTIAYQEYRQLQIEKSELQQKFSLVEGVLNALGMHNDNRIENIRQILNIVFNEEADIKENALISGSDSAVGINIAYDGDIESKEPVQIHSVMFNEDQVNIGETGF